MKMTNWYTADLHFVHVDVIRFCDARSNAVSFDQIVERRSKLPPNKHLVDAEPGVAER